MTVATAYLQNLICIYRNRTETRAHTLSGQNFSGVFQGWHSKKDEVKKQDNHRDLSLHTHSGM